jgi:hypothetical protein
MCVEFDFCFKCYPHRKLLHNPSHEFSTSTWGQDSEFMEPEEKSADKDSSTDTSSDDDSEDSD